MALPQLDEQAVGLPTIGTYEVQYTILADAPYNQSAANAKLTKITYNADGTFTIDGVTRSVQYILKTSIGPYSPSYPVMMIKATGGANILLAAPGFDLSKWIFVMPTMGSFQTTVSMSYNAPNATAAEKSTYSRGMYAGVAGWTGKCFLAGALIATPKGQVPVEELSAGDEILCFDCEGNKSVSIIDYVYNGKNQNWFPDLNTESCPVIIKENALADGIPNSDLTVTPEHCIFIDDFFVPVRMLVNGNSIYYDKSKTDYEYYHIYLKNHSIIEANGLRTERYLNDNSGFFEEDVLYQNNIKHEWNINSAANLNTSAEFVKPIYFRIIERISIEQGSDKGRMEDKTSIKNDISLLDQSGQVFECSRKNGNIHIFHVQTDSHDMAIQSNVFVPCDDIGPFIDDRRNLGALIGKITVFSGQDSHTYDKHLQEDAVVGWHSKENTHSRWTSGSGKLEGIISKKDNFNIIAIEVL